MIMHVLTCDRCKGQVVLTPCDELCSLTVKHPHHLGYKVTATFTQDKHFDLCPECAKELDDFLNRAGCA